VNSVWRGFLSDLRNSTGDTLSLKGSALPFGLAAHLSQSGKSSIFLAPSEESAAQIWENTNAVLGESSRLLKFPNLTEDPYGPLSPHPSIIAERARILTKVLYNKNHSLIVSPLSLLWKVPLRGFWRQSHILLEEGLSFPLMELKMNLWAMGYRMEDLVEGPGEYSARGSLLDIYPLELDLGLRVEFFGETIEEIRFFDPTTQRSLSKMDGSFLLGPLSEVIRSEKYLSLLRQKLQLAGDFGQMRLEALERAGHYLTLHVEARAVSAFFHPLSEFPEESEIVALSPGAAGLFGTLRERLDEDFKKSGRPEFLSPDDLFPGRGEIEDKVKFLPQSATSFPVERPSLVPMRPVENLRYLHERMKEGFRTILSFTSEGSLERFRDFALGEKIEPVFDGFAGDSFPPGLYFMKSGEIDSLIFPAVKWITVSEKELLGRERIQISAPSKKRDVFFEGLRDLKAGDYVVHSEHGIGRYSGIETIKRQDKSEDYLLIIYSGGDRLLLPMNRIDLIQKYKGPEGYVPEIDKLGSMSFKKKKERARRSVKEIADELIKIYARRRASEGIPAAPDSPLQDEFEKLFPFDLTADQKRALEDVKKDMESETPMDRIICGDVGFGKTEVAMRAAFKMAASGRKVAILCPTTVLALQHFENFSDRFSLFPVRVEMLSRFILPKRRTEILRDLKAGLVDIVIGTHRLLSKDVQIPELGLLIVDEEQRFGVMHKEKIKQFKADIDVLTLTATPIPRTLQMGLSQILDMSLIETPPKDRLSIDTIFQPFDEELVASAVRNELKRQGQVFYLHNRVETIEERAKKLKEIIPEARFLVAHGQLNEKELEKRMIAFYHHEADVLITTTIIENGVDIPRANTLIVENAHAFGLCQLYQIRGRIGRSNVPAYAYLLIPRKSEISGDAIQRLRTLEEFTELGSGFRIAAIDLELRGAGNFLGSEQSGHIEAVGFELYIRMLEEAVSELKGEPAPRIFRCELQLAGNMMIPQSFIENDDHRLSAYRELSLSVSREDVDKIAMELKDRFGELPPEVGGLLEATALRIRAERLYVEKIMETGNSVTVLFSEDSPIDLAKLLGFISKRDNAIVRQDHSVVIPVEKDENVICMLDSFFSTIEVGGKREA
jgi:transcription-repair coupling factor (superfamily II helicase)